MDNIVAKYKLGNKLAEDMLIDDLLEEYDYSITKFEARLLLHKKYGKADTF